MARGKGLVLPKGSIPPIGKLGDGENVVRLDGVDESGSLRCIYPDGFIKHHQVTEVAELLVRVMLTIQGRFGEGPVNFIYTPQSLDAGETIVLTR